VVLVGLPPLSWSTALRPLPGGQRSASANPANYPNPQSAPGRGPARRAARAAQAAGSFAWLTGSSELVEPARPCPHNRPDRPKQRGTAAVRLPRGQTERAGETQW